MTITRVSRKSGTTLLSRKTSEKWNPAWGMRELPGTPTPNSPPLESHVWLGRAAGGPGETHPRVLCQTLPWEGQAARLPLI